MTMTDKIAAAIETPPQDPASRALMPNLFVIGASKSGSSALHAYLKPHPGICMSREKEPCFFVDQSELEEAWPIMARQPCSHEWPDYLALWQGGESAAYRGEGSVYYSQTPHRSGVPARVAAACPDARIIYTVREPVSRAVAHYWQRFKEFQEPLPLDRAVRENALYRDSSDYALQLGAWLEHFDRSQIHVIVAEDLRSRRREVLAETIAWLGLESYDYDESEITDVHKSPPTSRKERFPMVAAVRNSGAWAAVRRHLPKSMVDRLRKSATVEFDKKDVDETAARAWLSEYLAPKIPAFEEMLGREIPAWRK
ncbi:sulfotransferase [Salipiger bermudensis]|uniref:sulfotransferase family protein n=1 Tax=Salipiger bermudensis TaxID=344736 RepID=UPI001C99CFEF|nr:sulfotransferase [Salipiger bermudensis]MBY6005214.1 sulfotransferase [Salipiger bermudensis]